MVSNLLGDIWVPPALSAILSTSEFVTREGFLPQKSLNYRDDERLSVVLALPSHQGDYADEWDEEHELYSFDGHDSTTVESGKLRDQIGMYPDGRLTDNGRFKQAADAFAAGSRQALQVQVYEKLDVGAWFDKGIFNLIASGKKTATDRLVFTFTMRPADSGRLDLDDTYREERFMSAAIKAQVWRKARGRCMHCGDEKGLRFIPDVSGSQLLCPRGRGENPGLLG